MAESILKGLRILAVDDEPDILETVQDILDESEVATASSYEEALKKLGEDEYDLAILDIMGVDGMQLLVETVNRRIPTVMLTAHAMNPEALKSSLDKPVSPSPMSRLELLRRKMIGASEMSKEVERDAHSIPYKVPRLGDIESERVGEAANQRSEESQLNHQ